MQKRNRDARWDDSFRWDYGLKVRNATLSATNVNIRAEKGLGAIIFDPPTSRPASLQISGGSLVAGGDAFQVTSAGADILVENSVGISPGKGGLLLDVRSDSHPRVVNFVTRNVELFGDIVSDSASATSVSLDKRSQLTGRIQSAFLQPYAKASFGETLSDGGELSAQGYAERPNLDGAGVEAGAGLIMQVSERVQIYGEYQFAATEKYVQPWSVNGGFRWLW